VGASNQTTLSSTGFNRAGSIRRFSFFFYLISATERGDREEEPEIALAPGGGRGGGVQGRQGGRQSAAPALALALAEDAKRSRAWPGSLPGA